MPIFRATVKKQLAEETWENRYYLFGDNLADVFNDGLPILEAYERSIHSNAVQLVSIRLDDNVAGTPVFFTVALSGVGALETPGELWPLFNTVRMDLTPSTGGYPGRKFYRGILGEGNVGNGGIIAATLVTQLETAFDTFALALSGAFIQLVDSDGDQLVNGVVRNRVQMRQLRRGRRRRP